MFHHLRLLDKLQQQQECKQLQHKSDLQQLLPWVRFCSLFSLYPLIAFPGDNFYSKGITADEYSNRFQTTFESVYKGDNLQTPWYVILGNHGMQMQPPAHKQIDDFTCRRSTDYKGNVTAQIEYSKYSQRWTMPSNFHFQSLSSEGVTVDIVLIDTREGFTSLDPLRTTCISTTPQ